MTEERREEEYGYAEGDRWEVTGAGGGGEEEADAEEGEREGKGRKEG